MPIAGLFGKQVSDAGDVNAEDFHAHDFRNGARDSTL
jgi:hypothetical protein